MSARTFETMTLDDVIKTLWVSRVFIALSTAFVAIVAVVLTLLMQNEYRSEAVLAPSAGDGGMKGSLVSQFGGLASLAGIDLGGGAVDKTTVAIERLKSKDFLAGFVRKHDLVVPLIAAEAWNQTTKTWKIDETVYNVESATWIREAPPLKSIIPSDWEIADALSDRLIVSQDEKSGLVKVSITLRSPEQSAAWLRWLISDINEDIRNKDIAEARRSIEFLEKKINETSLSELKQVFFQLMEQQTKTIMLADVRVEYAFQVVDKPFVPEEKVKPRRAIIVILTTMIGLIISCGLVLLKKR